MKVGIIGGTGKMGRLFSGVFERAGHEVHVRENNLPEPVWTWQRHQIWSWSQYPIRDTVDVIRRIAPLLLPTRSSATSHR